MLINGTLLKTIEADLCLNAPFIKGQTLNIRKCWHFSTDGGSVEQLFYDDADFKDGMNRIYAVILSYRVVILAFALMDTHIHFVIYGEFDECNRFIHEYIRRTSAAIERRHKRTKSLLTISISHQVINDDKYLKNVICYVCRNAPIAGLPFSFYDYPWSSAPLYFRKSGNWASPKYESVSSTEDNITSLRKILKTRSLPAGTKPAMIEEIIFPGEYVAVNIVERIFKSSKGFFFFMCHTREDEVEMRGGDISRLSIPIQEMRQNRIEMSLQLFGTGNLRNLETYQRIRLAKALRAKYNCSVKQIARVCGLVAHEAEHLL